MKIESSVTSISWIPSAAIAGVTRIPFEAGVTHYDDPPPDRWDDLDSVLGPEGARFANDLRAWIEVEDGQITGYGQGGGGRISNTLFRVAGMRIQVEAVGYPELRPEPVVGDGLRPVQPDGGRPAWHAGAPAGQRRAVRQDPGADGMDDAGADPLRGRLDQARAGGRHVRSPGTGSTTPPARWPGSRP